MDMFERTNEESDQDPTMGSLFEEIAEHGRSDEDGCELSDEDWADSQ